MAKRYASPEAFKQALEDRIRQEAARRKINMSRFRQLLVFDRFLARVKDLPDMALLAQTGGFDSRHLRDALEKTFGFRHTHELPPSLPDPPATWTAPYARMAAEDELPWRTLAEVTGAVRAFLDPLLRAPKVKATWSPAVWKWEPA